MCWRVLTKLDAVHVGPSVMRRTTLFKISQHTMVSRFSRFNSDTVEQTCDSRRPHLHSGSELTRADANNQLEGA